MLDQSPTDSERADETGGRTRRALVVADDDATVAAVTERLAPAGYEVSGTTAGRAAQAVAEFAPDVALIAFDGEEGLDELLALARRWRTRPATYALPVVFLFREDGRELRSAALRVGADDYFALTTPGAEMCARLDALFWRVEAGRRAAPVVGDQRAEIENFMLLLDAVNEDVRNGAGTGTLALVAAKARGAGGGGDDEGAADDGAGRGRLLAEVYGFLKLNLRRVDAVAFYGPTLLLAYLPGVRTGAAQGLLARLRAEFLEGRAGDLAAGLASFPAEGGEVESLVEKAEANLRAALARDAPSRIVSGEAETPATGADSSPQRASVPTGHDAAVPQGARIRPGSRRLLLTVSDAARMSRLNLLIRSAGYEVRAAFDGQQALNLLRIERPDLLLVDYELHDMDGLEMLRRLRGQKGVSDAPPVVLLLPARHEGLRGEALEAGARRIITLPYDPAELLDSVSAVQ